MLGIYHEIAVPLKGAEYRTVSMALLAKVQVCLEVAFACSDLSSCCSLHLASCSFVLARRS